VRPISDVGDRHDDSPAERAQPGGWAFWLGLVSGWAMIGYAVRGALMDEGGTNPPQLIRWVIGGAIVHDLLVAPVVTAVGLLFAWRAPPWWGRPVAAAFGTSALLVVFSFPLLRGFGRHPGNPSTLPRNYPTGLAIVLGAIWMVTGLVISWRAWRRRLIP
jgi:hypothetical protein